jgi:hypothetical protein
VDAKLSIAQTLTSYSTIAPNGFLLLDGSAYSETVFSELFAVLGHDWDEIFGQDPPPSGFFRIPISQKLYLKSLDENNSEIVTSDFNFFTLPLEYIYSGKNMKTHLIKNDDLLNNYDYIDGFIRNLVYKNNDFESNYFDTIDFGFERIYENDNFELNYDYNDGFSSFAKYLNDDLLSNGIPYNGFASFVEYKNNDLLNNGVVHGGFSVLLRFENIDFQANEIYNDGFIY